MTQSRATISARHRGLRSAVVAAGLVLTSAGLTGTAQAQAPAVTCGATLLADAVLQADLYCPAGDGITLAPGVTLDLGGHSLIGPGTSGAAVTLTAQSGNTVRNGRIKNWGYGLIADAVDSAQVGPSTITRVILSHAPVGSNNGELRMTWVAGIDSAVGSINGRLTIANSTLVRSGIETFSATVTVKRSALVASGFVVEEGGVGGGTIERSVLDGRGIAPLASCYHNPITIRHSAVRNYAFPINGTRCTVTLTGNVFANMKQGVLGGVGDRADDLPHAVVRGNYFRRSGIAVRPGGLVPVILENNTFDRGTTGAVIEKSAGSRAIGNTVTNNTDTGIRAVLPGLKVGKNKATNNGGYGIYAPGAVDLGGNVAYGNKLGQCVGLACAGK